jgi:hypothetical protein
VPQCILNGIPYVRIATSAKQADGLYKNHGEWDHGGS